MATDLAISETGNGGDLFFTGRDIAIANVLFQQIYLARFGGNLSSSTSTPVNQGREREDYWGNLLFNPNNPKRWFDSETQRVINSTPLNSSGRSKILRAAKKDVDFLRDVMDIETSVFIVGNDRIRIDDLISKPDGVVSVLWDLASGEIIERRFIGISQEFFLISPQGEFITDPEGNKIKLL